MGYSTARGERVSGGDLVGAAVAVRDGNQRVVARSRGGVNYAGVLEELTSCIDERGGFAQHGVGGFPIQAGLSGLPGALAWAAQSARLGVAAPALFRGGEAWERGA